MGVDPSVVGVFSVLECAVSVGDAGSNFESFWALPPVYEVCFFISIYVCGVKSNGAVDEDSAAVTGYKLGGGECAVAIGEAGEELEALCGVLVAEYDV